MQCLIVLTFFSSLQVIGPFLAAKATENKVDVALFLMVFDHRIIFIINKDFVIFGGQGKPPKIIISYFRRTGKNCKKIRLYYFLWLFSSCQK
jgi:hypothetical protein